MSSAIPAAPRPDPVLAQSLLAGMAALGIPDRGGAAGRLLALVELLAKWNRVYNLTAVRERGEMVTRHILDSLVVLPHLHGQRVLDVGTGAGLPGLPLAICDPAREFVLLDSNAKKTRFVQQAVLELGLTNVSVVQARVEDYQPERQFDTVVSRAFASVADFVTLAGPSCHPGGVLLAMKGEDPGDEVRDIPAGFQVRAICPLTVPGLNAQRHLVIIVPTVTH